MSVPVPEPPLKNGVRALLTALFTLLAAAAVAGSSDALLQQDVDRCDEITWLWEASDAHGSHCRVTGPDAPAVQQALPEPCPQ